MKIFALLSLITCFLLPPTTPSIVDKQKLINEEFVTVVQEIERGNYFFAFNLIKDNKPLQNELFINNRRLFKRLMNENRKEIISRSKEIIHEGQFSDGLALLSEYKDFYRNDEVINSLYLKFSEGNTDSRLVEYSGPIEHLFTNNLLAWPELSLSSHNEHHTLNDRDYITPNEFRKILESLYRNNYILVNISEIYHTTDAGVEQKVLFLPPHKKPVILSFENICFPSTNPANGMTERMIINRDSRIASYSSRMSMNKRIRTDNEFVPILDTFVEEHPDFSFDNARGMICLSGENGILGYQTQHSNPLHEHEAKKAAKVVKKLKENGWYFACNGYYHQSLSDVTYEQVLQDAAKWKEEVASIVGSTDMYVYPLGEKEVYVQDRLSRKHQALVDAGYKMFCGIGIAPYLGNLTSGTTTHTLIQDRKPLDGISLRNFETEYSHLFSCYEVYDSEVRIKTQS